MKRNIQRGQALNYLLHRYGGQKPPQSLVSVDFVRTAYPDPALGLNTNQLKDAEDPDVT